MRKYQSKALDAETVATLQQKIDEVNREGRLNIQLVTDEPKAFSGGLAYGVFTNVTSYFVVCGKKADDLDERVGYYGEQLVLLAQQLGLNTCWVGLTYREIRGTFERGEGEKVVCYIALGYGEAQGVERKHKTMEQLSNVCAESPQWFRDGVAAARLAPTAVNQQKFYFEYLGDGSGRPQVRAKRLFSLVGYSKVDLGIAKLHFEIAAGRENFDWA